MKVILLTAVAVAAKLSFAVDVAVVDFSAEVGKVRPELHSSGWAPRSMSLSQMHNPDIAPIKSMGFMAARTHDWALVNSGQRVVDLHFIFPLMHLDPNDPSNYVFGPTDHLLQYARDCNLEIFYRLGTSIEHTGPKVHFNSLIPEDFDKTAEVFAGIVRHYNRGWANGKKWNIRYWEIWNEPDGSNNMWCEPGGDRPSNSRRRMEKFALFFVTCLKRLKAEFGDEIKVGGPALCGYKEDYLQFLFDACRKEGVKPDFISWHYYSKYVHDISIHSEMARRFCDRNGLKDCELIVNEWHYMDSSWDDLRSPDPAVAGRCLDGPTGHNNIDSAAFTLANLALFQTSKLDQAYFYGCYPTGNWGYMDDKRRFNKNYYACRLFGELMRNYSTLCASKVIADDTYVTLALKSADGRRRGLLLVDYRNSAQVVSVELKGVGDVSHVFARILDDSHDDVQCAVDFNKETGMLTLCKPDKHSAAFYVSVD